MFKLGVWTLLLKPSDPCWLFCVYKVRKKWRSVWLLIDWALRVWSGRLDRDTVSPGLYYGWTRGAKAGIEMAWRRIGRDFGSEEGLVYVDAGEGSDEEIG